MSFIVDFADCDPAQIVFYPKYFVWFDRAAERMFRNRGMPWPQLFADYHLVGMPIVDTGARFLAPIRFGDEATIESRITE